MDCEHCRSLCSLLSYGRGLERQTMITFWPSVNVDVAFNCNEHLTLVIPIHMCYVCAYGYSALRNQPHKLSYTIFGTNFPIRHSLDACNWTSEVDNFDALVSHLV